MSKNGKVSVAEFRELEYAGRVALFKANPGRYRELMDEQRDEALANLLGIEHALQQPFAAPVTVNVQTRLSSAAELWACPPETRFDVESASQALHVSKKAVYQLCADGKLPRTKLGGRLSFTAATLRQYVLDNEVRS